MLLVTEWNSFACLLNLGGTCRVLSGGEVTVLKSGESAFIPADWGYYELEGTCSVLVTGM
jgi:mannose-6-phosphate isomerase class I